MLVNVLPAARWLVAFAMAAALLLVAHPQPARALTCATHPSASPRAIAEGRENLAVASTFQDRYDGAVFGTVVSTQTQDDGGRPDYGRTEVVVDVTGTFGPAAGGRAVIVADDPGWLNGYPFEVGTHYFIPYVDNEKGRYSHLCDPIVQVDPADVSRLVELAQQNAWADHATVSNGDGPSGSLSSSLDDATAWLAALVGALVLVAGAIAAHRLQASRKSQSSVD